MAGTRWLNRGVVILAVALGSGCVSTRARGPLLRTLPATERCVDTRLVGTLSPEADALRLNLSVSTVCEQVAVEEYQSERVLTLPEYVKIPAAIVTGALVTLPLLVAVANALERQAEVYKALSALCIIPAVAVGFGAYLGAGALQLHQPAPVLRVESVVATKPATDRRPSGTLRADGAPFTWEVRDGVAVLPLDQAPRVRLDRLILDGRLVELQGDSARRAEALTLCRSALAGWAPGDACQTLAARAEASAACHEFWPYAYALEARLLACGTPPGRPAAAPPEPLVSAPLDLSKLVQPQPEAPPSDVPRR